MNKERAEALLSGPLISRLVQNMDNDLLDEEEDEEEEESNEFFSFDDEFELDEGFTLLFERAKQCAEQVASKAFADVGPDDYWSLLAQNRDEHFHCFEERFFADHVRPHFQHVSGALPLFVLQRPDANHVSSKPLCSEEREKRCVACNLSLQHLDVDIDRARFRVFVCRRCREQIYMVRGLLHSLWATCRQPPFTKDKCVALRLDLERLRSLSNAKTVYVDCKMPAAAQRRQQRRSQRDRRPPQRFRFE